jgi:uncharacterized protein YndB with AHSA1/START domain
VGQIFRTELRIDAPVERVFEAMTEPASWHQWMQGLVRVDVLTDLPFQEGTRWRETRKMFGKEACEEFLVVACEPARRLRLEVDGSKGTTGKGLYRFDYDLTPEAGATMVAMQGEVEMPGFVAGLFSRLMVGTFKKACDRDLQSLKKWLERKQ